MEYIKYIPVKLNEITEYKEIGNAVDPELSQVKADMLSVSNNHFLSLLDEHGCTRMEKVIGITGMEEETLENRRVMIITKVNNTLPYTIRNLKSKIIAILGNSGFSINMEYSTYHLTIILYVQNYDKISYVKDQIEGIIPCNINLELIVLYNQYSLFKRYTYGELKTMTHRYMREHYFEEATNEIHY